MSLYSIINFISKTEYSTAELSVCNYFRGDINEYYRYGNEYINMLKNTFNNYKTVTDDSIVFINNNLWFYIKFSVDNNEIYWTINIAETLNKLNDRTNKITNF
jgi:hypothetical protein